MTLAVTGGRVLRPDATVERADVLIDREAGEILAVGPEAADGADDRLDASDSIVIPGLVNAHCHAAMTLLRGNADDKPLDTWLQEDIWPVESELTPEDVRAGVELGLVEMIRSGITAFADMYFEMDRYVEAVERSGMRALLGDGIITVGKDDEAARAELQTGREFAAEYDGAADGRVRTAMMPHSLTTVSPEIIEESVELADDLGVPVHFHANETENEVDPVVEQRDRRPIEWARELGLLGSDSFLAHGVHCDQQEIDLLANSGTGVAHCPASNMKLASGMAPVSAMRTAGVDVGIGTDGPASNNDLDGFDELRDAAMLAKLREDDPSVVPARAAVEMATAGAAAATGLPGGAVREGGVADLAVVDLSAPHLTPVHDPVSHLAYAVRASDVRHTICDGQVLMHDREIRTLDEAAVVERAAERGRDLVERGAG
jgi:5-methylthioadenosine/S-adenosylhomocysteine deaminase